MLMRISLMLAVVLSIPCAWPRAEAQTPQSVPKATAPKQPTRPAPPAAKPAPAKPAPAKSATTAPSSDEAARKAEILKSYPWRRAMFEFSEWLSGQQLYNAKEVADIKRRFNQRVARASADDLQFILDDLNAKFQILESQPAQDARAWMAQYLSVMSDKKREEVLKQMPNLATMTAGQLSQEILKIQAKRAEIEDEQASFRAGQTAAVNNQLLTDRMQRQEYLKAETESPATSSPYRSGQTPGMPPFSDMNVSPNMGFYVSPWGGVGMMFSP